MRFEPNTVEQWQRCQKTKPIMAKPLTSIFNGPYELMGNILLKTLEGNEPLKMSNVMCLGATGEPWQQTVPKLLAKYTVTNITEGGWLECTPIPGAAIEECVQITEANADTNGEFTVIGLWGETLPDGTECVQRGKVGDYVLRSPRDHKDVWIVRRSLFESTYEVIR